MDRAKTESAILHAAAEFINRESNRRSLITVTKVSVDPRGLSATVFVSVYPDTQAAAALDFLSRQVEDCTAFIKKRVRLRVIPHLHFQQDPNVGGLDVGRNETIA